MSRAIDADALEKEGWSLHRTIRVDMNTEEYQTKPLRQVPTIEPERKKGKWINIREGNRADCDQCGQSGRAWMNFCFLCGADMRG